MTMRGMMPEAALSSGKPMPRVGMGTASFPFGATDPSTVKDVVLRAIEAGYRHFDTAAVYQTEAILGDSGQASRSARAHVTVKLSHNVQSSLALSPPLHICLSTKKRFQEKIHLQK